MYLGIFYIHCIIHNLYPICIMGNNKYTKRKHGKKHSANKGNVSRRRIYRMRGGNTPTGKNEEENEGGLMDTIKTSLGQFADQFKGKSDESTDAANESTDGTSKALVFGSDAAASTGESTNMDSAGPDPAASTGESTNMDSAGPDPAASTGESANMDAAGPITPQVVPDNSEEVSKLQERIDELEKEVNQLTMKSDNLAREKEEVQENFAEKAVKAMMKLFRSDDSDDEDDEDDDEDDSQEKPDNDVRIDVEDDAQEQPDEDSL